MESSLILNALLRIIELLEKQEERYADMGRNEFDIRKDLLDSVNVMKILHIEKSTLYRLKISKQLHTIRIGSKDYYSRKQVESRIPHFMK